MGLDRCVTVNAYHNLAGWLRDVRGVLNAGPRDDLAATYHDQMVDLLTELMTESIEDVVEAKQLALPGVGPDESDSEDMESEDADLDAAVQRPRVSSLARKDPSRPLPSGKGKMGGAAGMADPLPRDVQAERSSRRSRPAPVARTGGGVKRGTRKAK